MTITDAAASTVGRVSQVTDKAYRIRPAVEDDLPQLPEIERAAGMLFLEVQMPEIAYDALPTVAELREYLGRLWVALASDDSIVGYLQADIIDGAAHIEQITVHPDHGRQGIGRRLIQALSDWSTGQGIDRLTLTTFTEIPWNAPYYASLGFEVMDQLPPGLQAVWDHEQRIGLHRWPRLAMQRLEHQ